MALKTLFMLLIFSASSIIKVHCSINNSSLQSLAPATPVGIRIIIDRMNRENKALFDYLPSPSDFNSEESGRNTVKSNNETFGNLEDNTFLTGPTILKFSRLIPRLMSESSLPYVLNLKNNGLYTLNPGTFEEVKGLKVLLLDDNNLGSLDATIFRGLHSLEILKIDRNHLSNLPRNVFRALSNLKIITLNANYFFSLPANLFAHNRKLKTVELMQNKVNLTILPSRLFSGFVNLEVVLLRSIGLRELSEDLFWNSCKLKEVDLSKNYLMTLPQNLLRGARKLRRLNLSSNHLTTLPNGFFITTEGLDQLDLSGNHIMALNDWSLFHGLHSLRVLSMESNGLQVIHPDAFIYLPNLKIAKFAHNHLNLTTGLHNLFGQSSPFHHCSLLEELDLSYNNVSQIFSDWIVEHTSLRKLDLSYNNFSCLETNDLRFNSDDLYVDLSHNFIKNVDLMELGKIPKNQNSSRNVSVNLNYNPIECYCDVYSLERYISNDISDFIKQEDLNYVKLLTDNLTCSTPEKLRGTLLKDLSNSSYTKISCSVENGRSAVCASGGACDCSIAPQDRTLYLNCRFRNLTEAPSLIFSWNIDSAHIDLRYNSIRKTPDLSVDAYKKIDYISILLSANKIERIDNNYNLVPSNLRELDLNDNKITDIDMEMIPLMADRLRKLEILDNPWPCNQRTLAIRDKMRFYLEQKAQFQEFDMIDFTCDDTTLMQPLIKNILVYTSLVMLILVILFAGIFIVYRRKQKQAGSLQRLENDVE